MKIKKLPFRETDPKSRNKNKIELNILKWEITCKISLYYYVFQFFVSCHIHMHRNRCFGEMTVSIHVYTHATKSQPTHDHQSKQKKKNMKWTGIEKKSKDSNGVEIQKDHHINKCNKFLFVYISLVSSSSFYSPIISVSPHSSSTSSSFIRIMEILKKITNLLQNIVVKIKMKTNSASAPKSFVFIAISSFLFISAHITFGLFSLRHRRCKISFHT